MKTGVELDEQRLKTKAGPRTPNRIRQNKQSIRLDTWWSDQYAINLVTAVKCIVVKLVANVFL
jgi:hypothetical protein